jgi:hypothetical protein
MTEAEVALLAIACVCHGSREETAHESPSPKVAVALAVTRSV